MLQILLTAITVSTQFKSPDWTNATLTRNHAEFRSVRQEIQKTYGLVPESALLSASIGHSALAVYQRSNQPTDAFKALYLIVCTNNPVRPERGFEELWSVLPKEDYEVARLHFLWSWPHIEYMLKPFGNRLIAVDGEDAEVLRDLAYMYSHSGPRSDEVIGVNLAERAAKAAPGFRTYLSCADAHTAILWYRKDGNDAQLALRYFEKYLALAPKSDPSRPWALKTFRMVKSHNY